MLWYLKWVSNVVTAVLRKAIDTYGIEQEG